MPQTNETIHDGFRLKFYVLDRQGRRLQNALSPDDTPPCFCELKDQDYLDASTKSDLKLNIDTPIHLIDKEIESKLLKEGRPLPCQIVLYGCTSWGKIPIQCAVADETLDERNIRVYVDKFLSKQAKQRTPFNELETFTPDEIDLISPQLTSLRTMGKGFTLKELVQFGYLEPLPKSNKFDSTGSSGKKASINKGQNWPHSNIFEIEVMFDEMRIGLQKSLPDINASAPHGEGSSSFSVTDDVPIDVRVNLINVLKIDLIDVFFEVDFDLTFSWLTRMPPFEVEEILKKGGGIIQNAATASSSSSTTTSSSSGMHNILLSDPIKENKQYHLAQSSRHNLWRPNWRFTNRVNDDIGDITESIKISDRQKMARGMKLSEEVVESYWPFDNPTRDETMKASKEAIKEYNVLKRANSSKNFKNVIATNMKNKPSLLDLTRNATIERLKEREKISVAESFDMLTRRFDRAVVQNKKHHDHDDDDDDDDNDDTKKVDKTSKYVPLDDGVEDVTEIVLKIRNRGLKFSFELNSLSNFPFDVLSLPILLGFRAPMGIYQASIVRTIENFSHTNNNNHHHNETIIEEKEFNEKKEDEKEGEEIEELNQNSTNWPSDRNSTLCEDGQDEDEEEEDNDDDDDDVPLYSSDGRATYPSMFTRHGTLPHPSFIDRFCSFRSITKYILEIFQGTNNQISPSYELQNLNQNNDIVQNVQSSYVSPILNQSDNDDGNDNDDNNDENDERKENEATIESNGQISKLKEKKSKMTKLLKLASESLKILESSHSCKLVSEDDGLNIPSFRPSIDFVPLPGRMRLRVSNDYMTQGVAEHHLRAYRWGIAEAYEQKAENPKERSKYDASMQVNVRSAAVHELSHSWATPVLSIRVHIHRKSSVILYYIYLPMFMMTFVSLNTILVGYGMELVSAFGDRCSITLTLLLTVVNTELPDHLKEVPQVKNLKGWAFQFIVFIIIKDILVTAVWWPTSYWNSAELAEIDPWDNNNNDIDDDVYDDDEGATISSETSSFASSSFYQGFYRNEKFPWWHRIWFVDMVCTLLCLLVWLNKLYKLFFSPKTLQNAKLAETVRFEADERDGNLLASGCYLRKYVIDRAAKFLHERWRAGYAQKHKNAYIMAYQDNNGQEDQEEDEEEDQDQGEKEKEVKETTETSLKNNNMNSQNKMSRSGSALLRSRSSVMINEEELESNPYPVSKGSSTISKKAEALWLKNQTKRGKFEVPPRWKAKISYRSPPPGSNPPTTKYYIDNSIEAQTEWIDPNTDICYVDINQSLDKLPYSAQRENMKSAENVLKLLETCPQAPRTELADMLHRQWVESCGTTLSHDNKLRNPWKELPMAEKIKNMVIVDAVIDMCALAHQVHAMVTLLFNKDGDGKISAEEFIMGELLRPLFKENIRVPVKKGDIVKVRDIGRNIGDHYSQVVVVGWYQKSYWNHGISKQQYDKKEKERIKKQKQRKSYLKTNGVLNNDHTQQNHYQIKDDDNGPVIFNKVLDTDNFFFSGTVFLVRIISDKTRMKFSRGSVVIPQVDPMHFKLLNNGEIHAIPETAIYWKEIRCNDFVRDMLGHSDWLFDSDGTCAINDHRCVPLKTEHF